jgi:FtsP/CotA-like multicopper oxidase with cupredoxin domain
MLARMAIFLRLCACLTALIFTLATDCKADVGVFGSLGEEQAREKVELDDMKREMNDIKSTTDEAIKGLNQLNTQVVKQDAKEIHLFCKDSVCEMSGGIKLDCLTYNGHLPGPTIRVKEGQLLKIVLHNQLKVPTSLHIHGMALPQDIDGLPRRDAGLVKPGESYVYQFVAQPKGTYFYHPQIVHCDQKARGLYGAIIVEPSGSPSDKICDEDICLVFSDMLCGASAGARPKAAATGAASGKTSASPEETAKTFIAQAVPTPGRPNESTRYYLINGQCAPAVPPIELSSGSRVRLRLVNAGQVPVPVHLSGHRFEIASINGDLIDVQTPRDTITLGVSDRVDVEFTANNPGTWSLGSEQVDQTTTGGKFPGGMACVVRYTDRAR